MEYFDVLDEKGNLIGIQKLRNLVHKDGDWHRVVHVWILNSKGEVLLQKRSPEKDSHPNEGDTSFAGHVVAGTDSSETVIKEAKEELGLDVSEKDLEFLFCYKKQSVLNNKTFINNEFNDVYILRSDIDISKIKLQEEEVSEVKWFTKNDLKEILSEKRGGYVVHEEEYNYLINKIGK